ncbi:MAG: NAD-dependent epimerase/dehydratase family protein [Deltaproteobacteria bacterium]|nr:NAD-dependent epimerase/dehydratase family protein [Deltaproteobacteria bacterium]
MRYFVTGATGFIGGRLVRQLREVGHEVRALVRDPSRAQDLVDLGVEVFPGDIREPTTMRGPMKDVDGVFHVAAWYKLGSDEAAYAQSINVSGTRNVLRLMKELQIPKGVYTSTVAVFSDTHGQLVDESYRYDGPMLTEYERTKHQAHYKVALPMIEQGLPLVIVMPGVVYGPGDRSPIHDAFSQYLQGRLPAAPKGARYCWGHVDDIARGHVLAMDKGQTGESYILAGQPYGLLEALDLAEQLTGIKAPRVRLPAGPIKAVASLMETIERYVPIPSTYRSESLRGAAGVTYVARADKAHRELGWRVRPLEEGLRETLEHDMRELGIHPSG